MNVLFSSMLGLLMELITDAGITTKVRTHPKAVNFLTAE